MLRLALVLSLFAGLSLAAWQAARRPGYDAAASAVAVVELFTSEGCSSCPPADRLLARLAADARTSGDPVFALAFHVDYWNRLGWTDPYSDAAFSMRQRAYSRVLGEGVYTPQMIVNGREAFVGSDAEHAHRALSEALQRPAPVTLALGVSPLTAEGVLLVSLFAEHLPAGAVVNLAVVERRLSQQVLRGENAGRTLHHENVVRVFETLDAGRGKFPLTLPAGLRPADAALIAYAQDPKTLAVLGAASVDLE